MGCRRLSQSFLKKSTLVLSLWYTSNFGVFNSAGWQVQGFVQKLSVAWDGRDRFDFIHQETPFPDRGRERKVTASWCFHKNFTMRVSLV